MTTSYTLFADDPSRGKDYDDYTTAIERAVTRAREGETITLVQTTGTGELAFTPLVVITPARSTN